MQRIIAGVLLSAGIPGAVCTMVCGPGSTVGEALISDPRLALVSFTGSTSVGERVSRVVHARFGRTILELGGNNASIVMPDADIKLAVRACVFGAVGTAGQRCTSLRRVIVHEAVYDGFLARLVAAYGSVRIGDPRVPGTLMGPLHSPAAVREFEEGIAEIRSQGGTVVVGGTRRDVSGACVWRECAPALRAPAGPRELCQSNNRCDCPRCADRCNGALCSHPLHTQVQGGCVRCAARLSAHSAMQTLEEAIVINNGVPQGLSSSLFTADVRSVFQWIGPGGSDCGIVNVNCGTSGAEIGGAFGGEKATGGGRESGSDSWKQYMRRSTWCAAHVVLLCAIPEVTNSLRAAAQSTTRMLFR